jgi:hypothetical protein
MVMKIKQRFQEDIRSLSHQNISPLKTHPFILYSLTRTHHKPSNCFLGAIPDLILTNIFIANDLSLNDSGRFQRLLF